MNSERRISPRFSIALVLSMLCLTSSACSNSTPAVDTSQNDRVGGPGERTPQVSRSRRRIRSKQTRSAVRRRQRCTQNSIQAKEWFEKAAMQGHTGAQAKPRHVVSRGKWGSAKRPDGVGLV